MNEQLLNFGFHTRHMDQLPASRSARFAAIGLTLLLSLALPVLAAAPRHPADRMALVFAPWLDQAQVMQRIAAADQRLVRFGRLDFVAVVEGGADSRGPADVWLRLDPVVAAGCRLVSPFTANSLQGPQRL